MSRATVDVSLPVAAQPSLEHVVEFGEQAESLGYNRLWLPETWGRDAVTTLATIAERTDRIGISNSVFPVSSRSPALVGQTAATLQEASDGRYRLGLGTSGPIVVENWHGAQFDRPLRRIREYIDIVRLVLSGEPVEYSGDIFDLSGFRLRCDPPETTPPIDVASMGPKAVELTGRFADGWQGIVYTQDGFSTRLDDLEYGASLGDLDVSDIRVTLGRTCCALSDADRARELVAQHVAFYLGGMGTYYRDTLAREGNEALAHEIHDSWQDDDRDRAVELVKEHLLDDAPVGTPDEARETLEQWREIEGVDAVKVAFPRGASTDEIRETLEALCPTT